MDTSHHALLLYAHKIETIAIDSFVGENDVQDTTYEKLGVAEAQSLVTSAHIRPDSTSRQTIVVRAQFITLEAQNALLKVFEEPPASTVFLLIVPADFIVLPTLLSRCERLHHEQIVAENTDFQTFLAGSFAERLALIDQAQKKKDTAWQRSIKQGLIAYSQTHTQQLKELEYTARLLLTRGASNKFLLEHVALALPPRSSI